MGDAGPSGDNVTALKEAQAAAAAAQECASKMVDALEAGASPDVAAARDVVEKTKAAMKAIEKAAGMSQEVRPRVFVSFASGTQPGPSSLALCKEDKVQLGVTFGLLVLALGSYANMWLVAHGHVRCNLTDRSFLGALVAAAGIDLFLLFLLRSVIRRCSNPESAVSQPGIPSRGVAMVVLILAFWGLVFAFGCISHQARLLGSQYAHPLYEAFLTIAAFQGDHYAPDSAVEQGLVMWTLLSAILLLIVFFPLLVGRLAMFWGESGLPTPLLITLKSKATEIWDIESSLNAVRQQRFTGDELELTVDAEKGVSRVA